MRAPQAVRAFSFSRVEIFRANTATILSAMTMTVATATFVGEIADANTQATNTRFVHSNCINISIRIGNQLHTKASIKSFDLVFVAALDTKLCSSSRNVPASHGFDVARSTLCRVLLCSRMQLLTIPISILCMHHTTMQVFGIYFGVLRPWIRIHFPSFHVNGALT